MPKLCRSLRTQFSIDYSLWFEDRHARFDLLVGHLQALLLHQAPAHPDLDAVESAVDGIGGPGYAAAVAEQLAAGIAGHEPSSDLHGLASQIHHAVQGLVLLFGFREDPTAVRDVHVTGLDSQGLLGPTARPIRRHEQVSETWIGNEVQQPLEFGFIDRCTLGLARMDIQPLGCGILAGRSSSIRWREG